MRKRLLASMIAMVLLLSLFPVSALAAERDKGSETPVACAVTGKEIPLRGFLRSR